MWLEKREDAKTEGGGGRAERWKELNGERSRRKKKNGGRELGRS